ncbi:nuclease-related domain-containing protein [Carnobacterium sp.]|uniref:nuclease-related domain-containing protein n=1 Tax=Carnobacterium sp. TaxID=48221 RepID=UPI0028A7C5DB|nr:nuclease-related domain-containing protein [Carnobacterium sp.]
MNDLPLAIGSTDFQIDALIITAQEILLYEVKNYGGEYIYNDGFLVSIPSGISFHSPTERINRHTSLLRSLLETHQMSLPIKSFVAFVHPEFMLYDVENIQKILLRATLPKHFRKLNAQLEPLSAKHFLLAKTLCELSAQTKPYLNGIPEYTYEMCRKGIICLGCEQFIPEIELKSKFCTCQACGHKERISTLISRHVLEYKRLFPERKLTTSAIYDWCGGICAARRIRSVLQKDYKTASTGRGSYYI